MQYTLVKLIKISHILHLYQVGTLIVQLLRGKGLRDRMSKSESQICTPSHMNPDTVPRDEAHKVSHIVHL